MKKKPEINNDVLKEDLDKIQVIIESRKKTIDELNIKNQKLKEENSILNKTITDLQNQQIQLIIIKKNQRKPT